MKREDERCFPSFSNLERLTIDHTKLLTNNRLTILVCISIYHLRAFQGPSCLIRIEDAVMKVSYLAPQSNICH